MVTVIRFYRNLLCNLTKKDCRSSNNIGLSYIKTVNFTHMVSNKYDIKCMVLTFVCCFWGDTCAVELKWLDKQLLELLARGLFLYVCISHGHTKVPTYICVFPS